MANIMSKFTKQFLLAIALACALNNVCISAGHDVERETPPLNAVEKALKGIPSKKREAIKKLAEPFLLTSDISLNNQASVLNSLNQLSKNQQRPCLEFALTISDGPNNEGARILKALAHVSDQDRKSTEECIQRLLNDRMSLKNKVQIVELISHAEIGERQILTEAALYFYASEKEIDNVGVLKELKIICPELLYSFLKKKGLAKYSVPISKYLNKKFRNQEERTDLLPVLHSKKLLTWPDIVRLTGGYDPATEDSLNWVSIRAFVRAWKPHWGSTMVTRGKISCSMLSDFIDWASEEFRKKLEENTLLASDSFSLVIELAEQYEKQKKPIKI